MTKQQKLDAIYGNMAISHEIYQWPDSAPAIDFEPVRIGDVLEYHDFEGTEYALLWKWENKRLPIDEQSEDCISFVYSLIQK